MTKDTLKILHLPERYDREKILLDHLKDMGIVDYRIVHGHREKHNTKRAIHLGHRKIVQEAKDNNLPYVIIAEDDITFFDVGAYEYYLSQIPQSYDLYFGMIMAGQIDPDTNRIISLCSGMTLYTVNQRFYDFFLTMDENTHIDREVTKYHDKFELLVCPKFVCTQNSTKSSNSHRCTDFTPLLKHRNLYKK